MMNPIRTTCPRCHGARESSKGCVVCQGSGRIYVVPEPERRRRATVAA